jgi:hypothetical protein
MSAAPDARLSPCGDVAVRSVDDGAVLVDMRSGSCFELNRVGYEIWQLVAGGTTEATICAALVERYGHPRERVDADVRQLLGALVEHKLLRLDPGSR